MSETPAAGEGEPSQPVGSELPRPKLGTDNVLEWQIYADSLEDSIRTLTAQLAEQSR